MVSRSARSIPWVVFVVFVMQVLLIKAHTFFLGWSVCFNSSRSVPDTVYQLAYPFLFSNFPTYEGDYVDSFRQVYDVHLFDLCFLIFDMDDTSWPHQGQGVPRFLALWNINIMNALQEQFNPRIKNFKRKVEYSDFMWFRVSSYIYWKKAPRLSFLIHQTVSRIAPSTL